MSKWNTNNQKNNIQKGKPTKKTPKGNSKTMGNKNLHQIKQISQEWKIFVMKKN